MKYLKNSLSNMKPYHSELITDGIILNANESPFLPPKDVMDAINSITSNVLYNRYPDMDENDLCQAIANRFNISKNQVTCGVGSDELLDVMFRAVLNPNDIVLGFSPSFSMYKVFADLQGAKYIPILGDENLIFNIDNMIKSITEYNPKLVLICSPNNPTGQYFTEAEVRRIIESTNALVALDLAYIDFSEYDYTKIALEYDNVISFRTFSKAMALPSIRVGYAISKAENIDMLNAIKAPYSVTTISQMIAKEAIIRFDSYKKQINEIVNERNRLYKELKNLGFNVLDSQANFLYLYMDDKYNEALLKNKIYIRNFKPGVYRISIGTHEENTKLLEVLKDEN